MMENESKAWLLVANPDLINITNHHWLQFAPPSCLQHSVIGVVYLVIGIPGILGNLLMLLTFLSSPALRHHSHLLSASLCLADLLMNLEIPILVQNSLSCGPKDFSPFACRAYGLAGGLSGTVAIVSIAGMAFQRYVRISQPFDQGNLINRSKSVTLVFLTWLYGLAFATFPLFSDSTKYAPEGFLTSCSFDYLDERTSSRVYILSYFLAAYVLPMIVIVSCYLAIVKHVKEANRQIITLQCVSPNRQSDPQSTRTPPPNLVLRRSSESLSVYFDRERETVEIRSRRRRSTWSRTNERRHRLQVLTDSKLEMERRLFRSVLILICNWTIAWTPYAVVSLVAVSSWQSVITPLSSMIPALFSKCASVLDPYIYFFSHPSYRREVLKLLSLPSFPDGGMSWFTRQVQAPLSLSRISSVLSRRRNSDRSSRPEARVSV